MSKKPLPVDMQSMLRQMRDSYIAELGEKLDEIETDLMVLEKTPQFIQQFESTYRRVHSLKGSAGTYGLPIFTKISHQLEEFLNRFGPDRTKCTREALDHCLAHVDLMRRAREQVARGIEHGADIEEDLSQLRAVLIGGGFSALVVETSKVNIKLLSDIMRKYPIHVTVLDNGLQALERLLHHRYHLLVTGLEIKAMNGLALTAAIRTNGRINHDILAILLSSSGALPPFKRGIDPNFIIARDSKFAERVAQAIESCITQLRQVGAMTKAG